MLSVISAAADVAIPVSPCVAMELLRDAAIFADLDVDPKLHGEAIGATKTHRDTETGTALSAFWEAYFNTTGGLVFYPRFSGEYREIYDTVNAELNNRYRTRKVRKDQRHGHGCGCELQRETRQTRGPCRQPFAQQARCEMRKAVALTICLRSEESLCRLAEV